MAKIIFILVALIFSLHAKAGISLCAADEQVVFSCSIKEKIVSVCASSELSPTEGYMQYRYGRPQKTELTFPEKTVAPNAFTNYIGLTYSGTSEAHLRFIRGNYGYIVYSGNDESGEYSGLVVERNGKIVSNKLCSRNPTPITTIEKTEFFKMGLPRAESESDYSILRP